jgi:hypothetical protein
LIEALDPRVQPRAASGQAAPYVEHEDETVPAVACDDPQEL